MKNQGSIEGKTNQEIADMYWQMADDLEQELNSDRGSETIGLDFDRIDRYQEKIDEYYELSIKYQEFSDAEKGNKT